ncbi:MAG: hypothetical protein JW889_13790, partial [Verrucomicrobia bacterium]|nr:hypothetical protein [Verrucomicrobiota bacterium]
TVSAGATSSHTDDSLNALAYRYVRNPATDLSGGIGSIAYQIDGSDYRYYHYNHKGDTGALTDADTDIIAWYEYDAWGNVVVEWQLPTNVGEGINGVENEFRYSTKQWDATPADATGTAPDAGLLYFGARSLDPSLGRWTQLDPAGTVDGLNMYLYAQNWPIAFVDPLGLDDRPSSDLFYHHKPRKCRDGTYDPVLCAENIAKAFDIAGCLTGRITYGIAYFGGFDAGHRQAIEQLWTMFQDCGKAIKNTCCKPPNPPVPVPEPVISPEPVPVPVVQPAPRRVPAPPPWYQRAWDAAWDAGAAAVDFVADNAVPVIAVGGAGVLIGADILLGGPTGEGIVPATGLLKWGFSR